MKKTILKAALTSLILSVPVIAWGQMEGACYDCHTMHNSEQDQAVAQCSDGVGGLTDCDSPQGNLLKFDCIACHANNEGGNATGLWTMPGGSIVPQVAHSGNINQGLAGGNFRFVRNNERYGHNVADLGLDDTASLDANLEPPGISHSSTRHVFTTEGLTTAAFDMFTCAGARGCHGTRSQAIAGYTDDNGSTIASDDEWVPTRRVGMAAISGSHHESQDGLKTGQGYSAPEVHNSAKVASGYRMIPGLWGNGNTTNRWRNSDAEHNEYYGRPVGMGTDAGETGCGVCHVQSTMSSNTRANLMSTIRTPNNSMSGFCSTCHGNFHSAGETLNNMDRTFNGVSGAFLRHPSDYTLKTTGEYGLYSTYDVTAIPARNLAGITAGSSTSVTPGTDMVSCISCHYAHGANRFYMLRFDYDQMVSNSEATQGAAQARGGCLACHSLKGED